VIVKAWLFGDAVAGWPSMMTVILFLGGVQLMALGMIGEYLGRLYDESKQRPLYLIADVLQSDPARVSLQASIPSWEQVHAHGQPTA